MLPEKTNISARVDLTLKKIVEDSTFNHKDAYELGAKLISIGDAEETMEIIDTDSVLQKLIKQNEYKIIQAKKEQLEKELRDLWGVTYGSRKFRHNLFFRTAPTRDS